MAEIKVVRKHQVTVAQAKKIAQKTADDLAEEYDLQSKWEGDTLHFSRPGVSGAMEVTEREIRLQAKLGLILTAFKARLEQHIEHRFDELLLATGNKPPKTAAAGKKSARKA